MQKDGHMRSPAGPYVEGAPSLFTLARPMARRNGSGVWCRPVPWDIILINRIQTIRWTSWHVGFHNI